MVVDQHRGKGIALARRRHSLVQWTHAMGSLPDNYRSMLTQGVEIKRRKQQNFIFFHINTMNKVYSSGRRMYIKYCINCTHKSFQPSTLGIRYANIAFILEKYMLNILGSLANKTHQRSDSLHNKTESAETDFSR
jgi:hypothetical protein